ncbi:Patch-forming domain C2 of tRNA-guanine transglycosylase [anaerobic digester metagenome]
MLSRVRTIADLQFGRGIGGQLFPDSCRFITSRRGGVRQVLLEGKRLATLRAHDGRLTLGLAGAKRLHDALPGQTGRVEVRADVLSFIASGKNLFSRHVVRVDPGIHAGDEVVITDEEGRFVAIGEAILSGPEMMASETGMAVSVRHGIQKEE